MENINIDITGEAPSKTSIAQARKDASKTVTSCARYERIYIFVVYGLLAVAVLGLGLAWRLDSNLSGWLVAGAALGAVSGTVGVVVLVGSWAAAAAIMATLGALVVFGDAFLSVYETANMVMFVAMIATGSMTLTMAAVYEKWVNTPRKAATKQLDVMTDLNYETHEEQCIKYDQYRRDDIDVEHYHQQLISMERKPVIAEYDAAKAWVSAASDRQDKAEKYQAAKDACERMTVAF